MTAYTVGLEELIRHSAIRYGPKTAERIMEAANALAAKTGADAFTARVGSIEWGALVEEMGYCGDVDVPQSVQRIRVGASVGPVECVLDPQCDGIYVSAKDASKEPDDANRIRRRMVDRGLTDATDAEIKAECSRRKMEMDPWLDAATTDELRAECERRGHDVVESGFTLQAGRCMHTGPFSVGAFKARVDELLAIEKAAKNPYAIVDTARIDPDAMNKALASGPGQIARVGASDLKFGNAPGACMECGSLQGATKHWIGPKGLCVNCDPAWNKEARRLAAKDRDESGPGIATLPEKRPEPLAHLDVDLLCDDAD